MLNYFLTIAFVVNTIITSAQVNIVGAMKQVMWENQLQANINIDTIQNRNGLCGIGPLAYLKGEIMLLDGIAYKSTVQNDTVVVEKTFNISAPFLGYTHVRDWKATRIPDSIVDIKSLENYLNQQAYTGPYFFKIKATITSAKYHIMNLPDGIAVTNPNIAHSLGQKHFTMENDTVVIIGFYSQEHHTILTHHDTNMHLHIINQAKTKMGHLEEVNFRDALFFLTQQ